MMVLNKRCIRRQIQYMLFCDVKEEEFELNREFQKNGIVYKEVRLRNRGCICKGCGTFHTGIKEYREKKIVHSIYACEPCTVIYHQRRFLCLYAERPVWRRIPSAVKRTGYLTKQS